MKLLNAFSLNMISLPCSVSFEEIEKLPSDLESSIGHADLAAILGVSVNRSSVSLSKGETFFIAQYIGPRLPEGSTVLPSGSKIVFIKGIVS